MSGLEEAIRKALDNAEREDANVRARIYQSARDALERGLSKQQVSDPKVAARQRRQLDDAITQIEREEAERARSVRGRNAPPLFDDPFAVGRTPEAGEQISSDVPEEPFLQMDPPMHAEPSVEMPFENASDPTVFPDGPAFDDGRGRTDADFTRDDFTPEPETGHLDAGALGGMGDISVDDDRRRPARRKRAPKKAAASKAKVGQKEHRSPKRDTGKPPYRKKKRGIFATGFMLLVVIAFVAAGAWWIMQSGFTMNPQSRDTAVPNPPPRIEAEDFEGASTWTPVYLPGQASGVATGASASAEEVTVDGEPALRIVANAAGDSGSVRFRIPPAVTNMLEDGPVLVEATVVAPEGGDHQAAIACYDGTIQGCQRHRYSAPAHRDNLVIQLRPNGGALPSQLMISSDVNGTGIPLDIFAIRARSVDEAENVQ
ncbi:hypothetical protein [Martelella mediterranea]|uniref:Biotin transporter BioY n=1 Tax=Martelella mediterranea TaxID=293089 RepID=A0A4R3NUE1_9HYPH|nr:hypothetical protein [Martelella mediterranea]TCT41777.1 hypothetical protein EDC90_100635 [Martelella mediterranea]